MFSADIDPRSSLRWFCVIVAALMGAVWVQGGPPIDDRVSRYVLPNGIHVLSIHIEEAPRQSTFTFLPLTMTNDPANQAQWSHLVEHLLIRSTDPDSLMVEGMQFNGETGADYLRLDSYVEPIHWETSIERHAKWISARKFDAETLEREKLKIAGEEHFVQGNGYTHKFSMAAWNQIVNHGLNHAEVHGNVATAVVEDVQKYAQTHLPVNEQVFIATIGPTDPNELKRVITESIGDIPATPWVTLLDPTIKPRQGDIEATWDLDRRHLFLWWEVSADSVQAKAVAQAVARTAMLQLSGSLADLDAEAKALVYPEVRMAEGRTALVVNILFVDENQAEAIVDAAKRAVAEAIESPAKIRWNSGMHASQFRLRDNFHALREQMTQMRPASADLLEANMLLNLAQLEFTFGMPYSSVVDAMTDLNDDALEQLAGALKDPPTGCLLLQSISKP